MQRQGQRQGKQFVIDKRLTSEQIDEQRTKHKITYVYSDQIQKKFNQNYGIKFIDGCYRQVCKIYSFASKINERQIEIEIIQHLVNNISISGFDRQFRVQYQQFLTIVQQIVVHKNIFKFVSFDYLSIVFYFEDSITNFNNTVEKVRIFFKVSPFIFKRNNNFRTKQWQSLIKFYVVSILKEGDQVIVPSDEQFSNSPTFLQQIHSNANYFRRLIRVVNFYHVQSLFSGRVNLDHKLIKQFYQKCAHRCSFSFTRMKKMVISLKLGPFERQKNYRGDLILNYLEDEKSRKFFMIDFSTQLQALQKTNKQPYSQFFVKLFLDFYKHYHDHDYIETKSDYSLQQPNGSKTVFKFNNVIGFCRLITEAFYFLEKICFKYCCKTTNDSIMNNLSVKLPQNENTISKKFQCTHYIEVKMVYAADANRNINANTINLMEDQKVKLRAKLMYETTFVKIILYRKKLANNKQEENQQFAGGADQLKGLTIYINQTLKKWALIDCYYHFNHIVVNYFHIAIDRNKQKERSMFRNSAFWKPVIYAFSALIQTLTRSFNSQNTTVLINILRVYEENKNDEHPTKQLNKDDEVMLLTFKYMKITNSGWVQVIPSCFYFFKMFPEYTILYCSDSKYQQQFGIKSTKQFLEKIIRAYLLKTGQRFNYWLPPNYYGSNTTTI